MVKFLLKLVLPAFAVGLTVEILKSAIPYLPLIWLVILAYYTWEAMTSKYVLGYLNQIKLRLSPGGRMISYAVVAIAGAALFSFYWWGLNSFFAPKIAAYEAEQRKKEVPTQTEQHLTADEIAQAIVKQTEPNNIEKVRRHRLRIDLTQYLSQGTIHRDWFLIFLQPTVEYGTGKPVNNTANITKKIMEIQQWNTELIAYITSRISGPKGIWFMSKIKNVQYPMEIGNNTFLQDPWDTVTSNLSKIEQLLREYPELPGEAKETELADKAEAADNSTQKLIHWTQEPENQTAGSAFRAKIVIRAVQDIDNPIFDVRFGSQIISASMGSGNDRVPPPIIGKEHVPGGNIYHFEVLHKLIKDRPITVIVESDQPITVKDVRVRLW